jgi:hypothetical protein
MQQTLQIKSKGGFMNIKAYMLLLLCPINLVLAEANQQPDPFMTKLNNLNNLNTQEFYQEWLEAIKILKTSSNDEVSGEFNGDPIFSPKRWTIYDHLADATNSPSFLEKKDITIAYELSEGEATLKYTIKKYINENRDGIIAAHITITDPQGTESKEYRTSEIKEDEVISNKLKEYPTLQKKYKDWLKNQHNSPKIWTICNLLVDEASSPNFLEGKDVTIADELSEEKATLKYTVNKNAQGKVTGYFRITDPEGSVVHEYCSPQKTTEVSV